MYNICDALFHCRLRGLFQPQPGLEMAQLMVEMAQLMWVMQISHRPHQLHRFQLKPLLFQMPQRNRRRPVRTAGWTPKHHIESVPRDLIPSLPNRFWISYMHMALVMILAIMSLLPSWPGTPAWCRQGTDPQDVHREEEARVAQCALVGDWRVEEKAQEWNSTASDER